MPILLTINLCDAYIYYPYIPYRVHTILCCYQECFIKQKKLIRKNSEIADKKTNKKTDVNLPWETRNLNFKIIFNKSNIIYWMSLSISYFRTPTIVRYIISHTIDSRMNKYPLIDSSSSWYKADKRTDWHV